MAMSELDTLPIYFYALRHPNGDVVAIVRSRMKGPFTHMGAYKMEEIDENLAETLEAFEDVDTFVNPIVA